MSAQRLDEAMDLPREMTLFLCGDVMTGRGIDQILPFPSHPEIHEGHVRDARAYVELAERRYGPIPVPVDFDYVWGDALDELERVQPAVRIVNLETSVTTSEAWEPKGINYRMHPRNVPCLLTAGIDCCVLANNHVLDWGRKGLDETIVSLQEAGLKTVGAGRDSAAAERPAIIESSGEQRRTLVFGCAGPDCGVPPEWSAGEARSGVCLLPTYSLAEADALLARVRRHRRHGDVVVVSIHWGSNWGYAVPDAHRRFAHRLVDSGVVEVVHGHSSHHPRAVEVRAKGVIFYGCGDFATDYEGISGYERYRPDLTVMYFVTIDGRRMQGVRMVPLRSERFRLLHVSHTDAAWLHETLVRESGPFGTRIDLLEDGSLLVRGPGGAT
jgi:poly-gamma-glutamate capsule biosynthesis protein CapA/YwtB (metallophosphatase superfamily)